MNDENRDNLSSSERDKLNALPSERIPRAEVEDEIIGALRQKGLIHESKSGVNWIRNLSGIAAALAIFLGGAVAGRMYAINSSDTNQDSGLVTIEREFMLLLYETPGEFQQPDSEQAASVIAEYSGWAGELAGQGQLIGAEKLTTTGNSLLHGSAGLQTSSMTSEAGRALAGYFAITAKSVDEALAISADCPHLKYGGEIELREIDHAQ